MDLYYERQLEAKIKRQAAEITRLLKENAELKGLNSAICDVCKNDEFIKETAEQARAEGQEEAWELARKIAYDGYRNNELKEIFGSVCLDDIFNLTYAEAAAKVTEWKRKKEEICVGDIVSIRNANIYGVVTYKDTTDNTMDVMASTGNSFFVEKEDCTKTGRHIDVNALLAQIGDER